MDAMQELKNKQQEERETVKARIRFAQELSEAAKRENEGLQVYYSLLDNLTPYWVENKQDPELQRFKTDIEEIIADELNHIDKLQKWAVKLGGVKGNKA